MIVTAAILLPVLLTGCGKKGQEGEEKTVQKSEDDFLDKDAKPDERKYLLAAKPFFTAVASRKYADAYALLSSHARARMSLEQFTPAQQDSNSQQSQSYAFDNVTAEQFAYLMQYVEAAHGAPRAHGKLGTSTSSARFKDDIKLMGKASEALFALQPVTFRYKKEIDPQSIPQFGLLAEEVEKVNADLVARDAEGKVNTVRYEQINAMLLNEFLKEHRKVQKLEAALEALTARLNEHDAKIQQVSNQLEIKSPDTRLAVSNR